MTTIHFHFQYKNMGEWQSTATFTVGIIQQKTLLCIKGPYNFLKFSGLALAQGWLDFHPSILGADGGKSNQPLVEFPSTGWISI